METVELAKKLMEHLDGVDTAAAGKSISLMMAIFICAIVVDFEGDIEQGFSGIDALGSDAKDMLQNIMMGEEKVH